MASAGSAINWLRDQVELIKGTITLITRIPLVALVTLITLMKGPRETEALATSVENTGMY